MKTFFLEKMLHDDKFFDVWNCLCLYSTNLSGILANLELEYPIKGIGIDWTETM
jgi:hypothetical protein